MKKSIIAAVAVLTLAGCSASAVASTIAPKDEAVLQTTNEKTNNVLETKNLIQLVKSQRNLTQMKKVIKYLKTREHRTSYVFSGSSPRGWDCSGLVRWTYERFGLELPHSANKQAHIGKRVSNPVPGDIVVFAYKGSTNFYHAAIYIGNGKIINAHYEAGTTIIQPLSDYKNNQIRFVRVIEQAQAKVNGGLNP
jgi:cell wall-associated NlpC family hydrolase